MGTGAGGAVRHGETGGRVDLLARPTAAAATCTRSRRRWQRRGCAWPFVTRSHSTQGRHGHCEGDERDLQAPTGLERVRWAQIEVIRNKKKGIMDQRRCKREERKERTKKKKINSFLQLEKISYVDFIPKI